ncbi:SUF system NifU family Fe-S cluster assembly protein [bacterium]|nr:SUF system NifU family Fe-S cluster assembly protein [bacterium]
MPFSNDPTFMREIILDHYKYPRNKHQPNDASYKSIHMDSVSCIDDFYIYLKVEKDVVKDVCFEGVGCAISTATTSVMTELVKGKSVEEAKKIVKNYLTMVQNTGEYDEDLLEEANAFSQTYKQANRIKCASLTWLGLAQLLENGETKNE